MPNLMVVDYMDMENMIIEYNLNGVFENKASIFKVFFCKKFLASSWCNCSLVVPDR
jgi:hypothetical protein